jgi:trans-aconitate 2-methyltransferase
MTEPHSWDPERYLVYADERGRPFVELLARVGATDPTSVVDLGCGPGTMTRLLAQRWPGAVVTGIDTSPAMVDAARAAAPGIDFRVEDVRDWSPPEPVDVLFSHATLQWIPGHLELLPRLVAAVAPGGWFAFGVPGNFDQPTHTLRTELTATSPYVEQAGGVASPEAFDAATYAALLTGLGCEVDAWETTYLHQLDATRDPDPVYTWISGTGARPVLEALDDTLRPAYEEELKVRLRAAYPVSDGRVLMPFRRVFVVARILR